jgi:NADH-ubiquinone oxidoreductase chain 4L
MIHAHILLSSILSLIKRMYNISWIIIILGLLNVILKRKEYLLVLISLELIFIAISILFLILSLHLDDFNGLLFSFYIFIFSATDSALALSLLIIYLKYIK